MHKQLFSLAAIAGVMLAMPALAGAATRYAEPGGAGDPEFCSQADPCSLEDAVESSFADDGDVVIAAGGTYVVTDTILLRRDMTLRGAPGARPRIVSSVDSQVLRTEHAGARVQDLALESTVADFGGVLGAFRADVVQRVTIKASGPSGPAAATVSNGAVLRDSVAYSSSASGVGVISGGTGSVLRNVTAVADGPASRGVIVSSSFGPNQVADLRNVIASGVSDDIFVVDDTAGSNSVSAQMSYSNFDDASTSGADASVVEGPGNQSAPPLFVNAGAANFHQAHRSPTIDAGLRGAGVGPLDVDGQPRVAGAGVDIGADELIARCRGALATRIGTPGPDLITGTSGRDVVAALGGADRVFTGAGNDLVCAGAGNDRVSTRGGVDRVHGGGGADRIRGGGLRDFLFGQAGADRLIGNAGPDRLFGGAGRDTVLGLAGRDDRCFGGAGRDNLPARGCELRVSIP